MPAWAQVKRLVVLDTVARQTEWLDDDKEGMPVYRNTGEPIMTNTVDPTLPQAPPLPTVPAVPSVDPLLPDAVPPSGAPQEQPDQEGDPLVPHPEQWTNTDVPADAPTEEAPQKDEA